MTIFVSRHGRHGLLPLALLLLAACSHPDPATLDAIPDDVRESVDAAVARGHRVGVVVGLVNPNGRHFHASGLTEAGGETPMTPETLVGIGSLTKLFTAELLADAVVRGDLALDIPVAPLLDARDAADTRLWHLATHRAGLPRELPQATLASGDVAALQALLAQPRELPAEVAYSNAGYALLGEALAQAADSPLAVLIETRLLEPMSLGSTGYTPGPAHLARPHQGTTPVSPPAVPEPARGAGGLFSSAEDLLSFVGQHLSPTDERARARLGLVTGQGLPGGSESLGWKRHRDGGLDVFHHGGDGNGYQAFVAFRPGNGTGVVLLTNSSADDELQRVALHLLDPTVPLPDFDHAPALALDTAEQARYAGRYRLVGDANAIELVASEEGLLFVEYDLDGELVRRSRLFATAPGVFELREIPVTITFDDPDNATLTGGGQSFALIRESAHTPQPGEAARIGSRNEESE